MRATVNQANNVNIVLEIRELENYKLLNKYINKKIRKEKASIITRHIE